MAKKALPSPEVLRQLLRYEPETGKLFWRARSVDYFNAGGRTSADHAARTWNKRFAGAEAFTITTPSGYRQGGLFRRMHQAHRVIWAIATGKWPSGEIDHINGDRADNRLFNLRDVSKSENQRNSQKRSDNKSGVTGVHKQGNGWIATVCSKSIGYHRCFGQAVAARKAAERARGFHPNHGRSGIIA